MPRARLWVPGIALSLALVWCGGRAATEGGDAKPVFDTVIVQRAELIHKLVFATLSVVALVVFAVGWREGVIIGVAVTITLSATLFASWAAGFTINRVSLFALIFAIGILVDDAIVVVENVHRRLRIDARSRSAAITAAVDEVGGPTILATFTVIAALLPMAFVSGLMGPYMSPIPINASMGMLISLAIALDGDTVGVRISADARARRTRTPKWDRASRHSIRACSVRSWPAPMRANIGIGCTSVSSPRSPSP